jgi:hypothetical protein
VTEQCNPQEFAAKARAVTADSDYGKSPMSDHPLRAHDAHPRHGHGMLLAAGRRWDFASVQLRRHLSGVTPANSGMATSIRNTLMTPTDAALVAIVN